MSPIMAVREQHSWVDAVGSPWSLAAKSDRCSRCGRTPDEHRADCATPLGNRLVRGLDGLEWVPYSCSKPAIVQGTDGRYRCIQHDRISRGLSGKWTNP